MFDKKILKELYSALEESMCLLKDRRVFVGFDGYIDKLVHLKKNQKSPPEYYTAISEFSEYIASHSNQSSDIEVDCISEGIGGNGVLLADALAAKGIDSYCLGAFGYPELHRGFEDFAGRVHAFSVEQPANTFAMEFADGKLMFGDSGSLARIDYSLICERTGRAELAERIDKSSLFCFTNWSGLLHSNDILAGILREICPWLTPGNRMMFFDLADPSPKSPEQFREFFGLLEKYAEYFWIILGLNPKECLFVYNHFLQKDEKQFRIDMLEELRFRLPVHEITVHGIDFASTGTRFAAQETVNGERVQNPRVVTGGGDNFNSGYCAGKLMNLPPPLCACLGNLSSMLYVSDGIPPSLKRIQDSIRQILFNQ